MKRSDLVSALKLLLPGIDTGVPLLEGADTFMFSQKWITSNNGRIFVAYPFDAIEVEGGFKAIEFYRVLEKLEGDELTLTVNEDVLEVECGNTNISMYLVPLPHHAELDVPTEWIPVPSNFMEAIKLCSISVVSNPILGILSGLYVSGKNMLTCDNSRASWFDLAEPMKDFVITAEAAKHIAKFDIVEYNVGESEIAFKTKEGVIYSCSNVPGEYPSEGIKALFVAEMGEPYLLPKALGEALERASLFAFVGEGGSEYVSISLDKNKQNLIVKGEKKFGAFKEKVKVDSNFPDGTLYLNPKFLASILEITNEMYDVGNKQVVFQLGDFRHLVCLVSDE